MTVRLIVSSPAARTAAASGPEELIVFHAVSSSGYVKGQETLPLARMVSPTCSIDASSLPGSASANVLAAVGGVGRQAITALSVMENSLSSVLPGVTIATYPPGFATLLASRSACSGSSANWSELNAVTISNDASA